ncbi:hypothetical protein Tco_1317325 [Tanacetum coccineum]
MTVQERYTDEEQEQTRNHWSTESLLKVNPQNYQEHPGCQITRETVTTDQHDELIKMGIKPTSKGVKWDQKFPYVILCAPPSRSSEFRHARRDVSNAQVYKEIVSLWNGECSFLFTSSSAPYDRYEGLLDMIMI